MKEKMKNAFWFTWEYFAELFIIAIYIFGMLSYTERVSRINHYSTSLLMIIAFVSIIFYRRKIDKLRAVLDRLHGGLYEVYLMKNKKEWDDFFKSEDRKSSQS